MTTKRKTTKSKSYTNYTCAQLATCVKSWQKKWVAVSKAPTWKTFNGKTRAQHKVFVQRELTRAVKAWRTVTLAQINVKLKALKAQMATRLGYTINSSKVTSPAIKRLTVKKAQVSKCSTVPTIIRACTGFKATSYKNPSVKAKARTKTKTSYSTTSYSTTKLKAVQKEIQKLKLRNSVLRSQVSKFRKEAAQLQRHYSPMSSQTPQKVEQDVSNIIRFSNALGNALQKQQQRRASSY